MLRAGDRVWILESGEDGTVTIVHTNEIFVRVATANGFEVRPYRPERLKLIAA